MTLFVRGEKPVGAARLWPVVAVVLIALGLRLYCLGDENFWIDEVYHAQVAAQPVREIVGNYHPAAGWLRRDQAPLSFVVAHLFLAPDHREWSGRLPSAIFGALGVLALFVVARQLFADPVPLFAALFLALSPLDIWYSQELRWYAQWTFLVTASYGALLWVWKSRRAFAWAAYGVLSLLGVYTFVLSWFVIACQAVTVGCLGLLGRMPGRFLRTFFVVQLAVIVAATPVLWVMVGGLGQPAGGTGTPRPTSLAVLPYTLFAFAAGFSLGPTLSELHALPGALRIVADYPVVMLVSALFLALLVVATTTLRREPAAAAVLLPWLCGPPLLVYLLTLHTPTYEVRYTMAALPAFLMLAAVGLCGLEKTIARRLMLGCVLACFLASLANYYWNPRYDKEDVRGALAHVRSSGLEHTPVLTLGDLRIAADYYGRDLPTMPPGACKEGGGIRGVDRAASLPDAPALWMLIGRDWDGQARRCLEQLSHCYMTVERHSFTGVDLLLLTRRPETSDRR